MKKGDMGKWMELSVEVPDEAVESVREVMAQFGVGGAVVEQIIPEDEDLELTPVKVTIKIYLPYNDQGLRKKQELEEALWHLGQILPLPVPSLRYVEEHQWLEAWKKFYPILHIGSRLVVKPAWEDYIPQPGEVVVEMEPGVAFGTGLHPTTRLCLIALEEIIRPGDRVLDVGTGSGILALFAAKLGAAHVVGIDVDEIAVKTARGNVVRNGLQDIVKVQWGSLIPVEGTPLLDVEDLGDFDIVLANITAPVIMEMASALAQTLAPEGHLVVSGIVNRQCAATLQALEEANLRLVEQRESGDWVTLIVKKLNAS